MGQCVSVLNHVLEDRLVLRVVGLLRSGVVGFRKFRWFQIRLRGLCEIFPLLRGSSIPESTSPLGQIRLRSLGSKV